MSDSTTPGGLIVLGVCAALIYLPTLAVDLYYGAIRLAHWVDDNLWEF